jgi:hypothetical protein
MNIDLKLGNREIMLILIIIVLLGVLISCNNSGSMFEGMTSACDTPPYGDNIQKMWYDPSCSSMNNNYSFALLPSFSELIGQDSSNIDCRNYTSEASFNSLFLTSPNQYNAYYYDNDADNTIQLINIQSHKNPTIIFKCDGTTDQITIPGIKASSLTLDFKKGNITKQLADQSNVKVFKYPDDFQDITPSTSAATTIANQNQNSINVNVDSNVAGNIPATAYNPALSRTTNTTNIINPSTGGLISGQTFDNPVLQFGQPLNSVSMQPSFTKNLQHGWNTLFGSGGSDGSLSMNNLVDLNGLDSSTPSTLFTTSDGRQGIANTQNTISGIASSQIPQGQQDLYILKSQVVPPVCPACPPVIVDKNTLTNECPPCPACARCPEPSFDCKKVPNYSLGPQNSYLPRPVLNDFSTFGT